MTGENSNVVLREEDLVKRKARELMEFLDDDPESLESYWKNFQQKLLDIDDINDRCNILVYEIKREVVVRKVKKGDKKRITPSYAGDTSTISPYFNDNEHRRYSIEDAVYFRALRRSPPDYILKFLENIDIDPSCKKLYEISRELFKIVDDDRVSKEKWMEFQFKYQSRKNEINNYDEFLKVLKFRHTYDEETILIACAKKKPPLQVIKQILGGYREAVIVPSEKYDWIPLHYAIKYSASVEVVKELIPKLEERLEYDFLVKGDRYRNRNPLHWAMYYNSNWETIKLLVEAFPQEVLFLRDCCGHRPFESAIWWGRSTQTIELLFKKESEDVQEDERIKECTFEDVMVKLLRTFLDLHDTEKYEKFHQVTPCKRNYYTCKDLDLPSICTEISQSERLQEIVMDRSCDTIPTLMNVLNIYTTLSLLVSYHVILFGVLNNDMKFNGWWFPCMVLLTISIVIMFLREVVELCDGFKYFSSPWNYFEAFTIIVLITSWIDLIVHGESEERSEWFGTIMVITSSCLWLNLILLLRSSSISFAIFVCGLLEIIKDLIPFLIISVLILLWFAVILLGERLISGRCESSKSIESSIVEFCTFPGAILTMYSFFVGGISIHGEINTDDDLRAVDDVAGGWEISIVIIFSLLVGILLLNVVIAIVNESWGGVVKLSEQKFWQYRLEFLMDAKTVEQLFFGNLRDRKDYQVKHNFNGFERQQKWASKIDKAMHAILIVVWPSDKYFGTFRSFFERVLSSSKETGSWGWQFNYEIKMNSRSKFILVTKTIGMIIIFPIIGFVALLLGLMSFGAFWPTNIKEIIIFGHLMDRTKKEDKDVATNNNKSGDILIAHKRDMEMIQKEHREEMQKMQKEHKEEMNEKHKEHMEEMTRLIQSLISKKLPR